MDQPELARKTRKFPRPCKRTQNSCESRSPDRKGVACNRKKLRRPHQMVRNQSRQQIRRPFPGTARILSCGKQHRHSAQDDGNRPFGCKGNRRVRTAQKTHPLPETHAGVRQQLCQPRTPFRPEQALDDPARRTDNGFPPLHAGFDRHRPGGTQKDRPEKSAKSAK